MVIWNHGCCLQKLAYAQNALAYVVALAATPVVDFVEHRPFQAAADLGWPRKRMDISNFH